MLFLVGLGLGDPTDITVKGLDIVRSADVVYLEAYTSILCGEGSKEALEKFYGRPIVLADREMVESDNNEIIDKARNGKVALLVVGDPFGATTHTDMVIRAMKLNIPFKVVHNASIMNAVAACGLQLYSFGETVSIPLWEAGWQPTSFVDKILKNRKNGLHTLCLLDIKVKEPSLEALMKGKRNVYEPPRFMSTTVAAQQICDSIDTLSSSQEPVPDIELLTKETLCIGMARVGSDSQRIKSCSLAKMCQQDLGPPLHALVIPGSKLHPLEEEMLTLLEEQL